MYESEQAAQDLRAKLRSKDDHIDSLTKELEDIKKSSGTVSKESGKKGSEVREEIKGINFH